MPDRFNQMLLMAGAPLLSAAHSRFDRTERQRIFCLMTDWSVRCALPLVVFLLFFAHPVLALYGAEFADRGAVPLQILVAATLFGLLCGPVGNVALMSGLEREEIAASVATTTLMLLMLLLLVPYFAIVGAAVAIAAGTVLMNLAMVLLDRWRLDLHWHDKRFLAWLPQAAANIALAVLASHFLRVPGAAELFALLATMYALAIVANLAWGLHKDDRELLSYVWKRIAALK
jgi:O-antigen/teichoic acid export membrane protein